MPCRPLFPQNILEPPSVLYRLSESVLECQVYELNTLTNRYLQRNSSFRNLLRSASMLLPSFLERFVATFLPKPFQDLARLTGWCKRQGKIDSFEFLTSLVFGQLSALRQTLVSQAQSFAEPVTPQAVASALQPQSRRLYSSRFCSHASPDSGLESGASPGRGIAKAFHGRPSVGQHLL